MRTLRELAQNSSRIVDRADRAVSRTAAMSSRRADYEQVSPFRKQILLVIGREGNPA